MEAQSIQRKLSTGQKDRHPDLLHLVTLDEHRLPSSITPALFRHLLSIVSIVTIVSIVRIVRIVRIVSIVQVLHFKRIVFSDFFSS